MELKLHPKLPYNFGSMVDDYLKVFKKGEKYDAYSLDTDTYEIIKGKGFIENDGAFNTHKREDDSKDVLCFTPEGDTRHWHKWWTVSFQEIKGLQCIMIGFALSEIDKARTQLEQLKNQEL